MAEYIANAHEYYWYLSTPYSNYELGRDAACEMAYVATVLCMKAGINALSPIAHCHDMAKNHSLPTDYEFWKNWNHSLIRVSRGIIVVTAPGWSESKGVNGEMTFAGQLGKPIFYMKPNGPPPDLTGKLIGELPKIEGGFFPS